MLWHGIKAYLFEIKSYLIDQNKCEFINFTIVKLCLAIPSHPLCSILICCEKYQFVIKNICIHHIDCAACLTIGLPNNKWKGNEMCLKMCVSNGKLVVWVCTEIWTDMHYICVDTHASTHSHHNSDCCWFTWFNWIKICLFVINTNQTICILRTTT